MSKRNRHRRKTPRTRTGLFLITRPNPGGYWLLTLSRDGTDDIGLPIFTTSAKARAHLGDRGVVKGAKVTPMDHQSIMAVLVYAQQHGVTHLLLDMVTEIGLAEFLRMVDKLSEGDGQPAVIARIYRDLVTGRFHHLTGLRYPNGEEEFATDLEGCFATAEEAKQEANRYLDDVVAKVEGDGPPLPEPSEN